MSESNRPTTIQDKLIADVKLIVADAEALVHATADQAEEKVADLKVPRSRRCRSRSCLPEPTPGTAAGDL